MKQLLLIFLLFTSIPSLACDCNYAGPFLKMAPQTKLVALVKVTKFLSFKNIYDEKTPMSMEVEVVENYNRKEPRKKIIIWGDPGNLCRPYLNVFKEGSYYVMALFAGQPNSGHPNEEADDYAIGNCGAYWLSVDTKSSTANGDINSANQKNQTIGLKDLKAKLVSTNKK